MTAEQRAGLSDAALAMTQPCIDELIKDISRRVQKAGAITDTAEYQIYRAQALGEGKKAIEQAVSKQIGISEEVIASLFEYVADKSLSPDENGSLKRMTEAYTRMTQSKTRELLRDLYLHFSGDEIIKAHVLEECDPLSAEISINTLNITLFNQEGRFSILNPEGYFDVLQHRQKLTVWEDVRRSAHDTSTTSYCIRNCAERRPQHFCIVSCGAGEATPGHNRKP